jgi:putative CocE/NonD family hydrolase
VKVNSHLFQRLFHLAAPATRNLTVERDLKATMRDGTVLLADRWIPAAGGDGLPVALLRTPYGRSGPTIWPMAGPLAERGFQVVVQSTRGTFGSGGPFDALRHERQDGLDTLDWLIEQPWAGDAVVLVGGSYLGYVQWAVADAVPPQVKAMIPAVSESALTLDFLRADGFSLETPFGWGVQVAGQEDRLAMLRGLLGGKKTARALRTLPLRDADIAATGRRSEYIQSILAHDSGDPYWAAADHSGRVSEITIPASLIGGWYDIFLPGQLRDFRALRNARLTVGPWTHLSATGVGGTSTREALEFGLAHASARRPPERAPVRLFVMGHDAGWRDFPSWPPPGYHAHRLHLQADAGLSPDVPAESTPDSYRYDPVDPTPAVGGVRMSMAAKAGPVDNTRLEARPDVLIYTTPALDSDVEVVGEVAAEIWFQSSLRHADVFARLCDIDAQGRSTNVCDGLISLTGADEISRAVVKLWPTAYRFRQGHRIRLQVSSGAFPRFNRNPGTGEPRADAVTLRSADQQVFHGPEHPSALILPIRA